MTFKLFFLNKGNKGENGKNEKSVKGRVDWNEEINDEMNEYVWKSVFDMKS